MGREENEKANRRFCAPAGIETKMRKKVSGVVWAGRGVFLEVLVITPDGVFIARVTEIPVEPVNPLFDLGTLTQMHACFDYLGSATKPEEKSKSQRNF